MYRLVYQVQYLAMLAILSALFWRTEGFGAKISHKSTHNLMHTYIQAMYIHSYYLLQVSMASL